jgi:hypothetical protein
MLCLDEVKVELSFALGGASCCQLCVGLACRTGCLEIPDQIYQRVHGKIAQLVDPRLNRFDPGLQFGLGLVVTGLAGVVDVQQWTAHVVIADLDRTDAHVGHVAVSAGHTGAGMDALMPQFELRMLGFEHGLPGLGMHPVLELRLVVLRHDTLHL